MHLEFAENDAKNKIHPVNSSSAGQKSVFNEVRGEGQTGWRWQEGDSNANNHAVNCSNSGMAEEHLLTHTVSTL